MQLERQSIAYCWGTVRDVVQHCGHGSTSIRIKYAGHEQLLLLKFEQWLRQGGVGAGLSEGGDRGWKPWEICLCVYVLSRVVGLWGSV